MIFIFLYNNEKFFYESILNSSKEQTFQTIETKNFYYNPYKIKKANNLLRTIYAIVPKSSLYYLQKNLLNNFLTKIPLSPNVYGFIKNLSYRDYLYAHTYYSKEKFFLRLDIHNFFESINTDFIKDVFNYYFRFEDDNLKNEIINIFTEIVTFQNFLPQGAITSPTISNIIFRQFDLRINRYCRKRNVVYSRYADDLLFSSEKIFDPSFIKKINYIISERGLSLNSNKTISSKNEISLNGFVLSNNIRFSRKRNNDILKTIYIYNKCKYSNNFIDDFIHLLNKETYIYRKKVNNQYFNKNNILNYFCGIRSFLICWSPKDYELNFEQDKISRKIKEIEDIIDAIKKYI